MKKFVLILLLFFSQLFYAQVTAVKKVRVDNATTAFNENLPKTTEVTNVATGEVWQSTAPILSTATLTTASASFDRVTLPGIDDNSTSVAMTIDANERVAIGTTSPITKKLFVSTANASADGIWIENTIGSTVIQLNRLAIGVNGGFFHSTAGANKWQTGFDTSTDDYIIKDLANANVRFRIARDAGGAVTFGADVTVNSLIKSGGTSDDILLGDGTTTKKDFTFLKNTNDVIFIGLTGQSNAEEVPLNSTAPGGEIKNYTNFHVWNTSTNVFDVYNPSTYWQTTKHNVLLSLAIEFEAQLPGVDVYAANWAVSGTKIELHFPGQSVYDTFYTNYFKEATENLIASGKNPMPFLIMFQGETDSNIDIDATNFEAQQKDWVKLWKERVALDMPIINVGIFSSNTNDDLINQSFINRESDTPNYAYIETSGTTPSGVHYTYADFRNIIAPAIMDEIKNMGYYGTMVETRSYTAIDSNAKTDDVKASYFVSNTDATTYNFASRVIADGGTINSLDALNNEVSNLTLESIHFSPSATKTSKTYGLERLDSNTGTDGDFAVVAANGSVTNQSGVLEGLASNIAKIDYSTGKGVLYLESGITNLVTRNEEIDHANWTKTGITVTANSTLAPDGTTTAEEVKENSGNSPHYIFQVPTVTASADLTVSGYFKKSVANDYIYIRIRKKNGGNVYVWFNIYNGTVGAVGTGSTAIITDVGDGWYRCSSTVNVGTGATSQLALFGLASGDSSETYLGDGSSATFIWGLQAEESSIPTSYVQTVASTVARTADEITGAGSITTINSQAGVLALDMAAWEDDTSSRVISVSDATNANIATISYNTTTNEIQAEYTDNSVAQATLTYAVTDITAFHKVAFSWAANNFVLWIDGKRRATSTSGTVVAANTFTDLSFTDGAGTNDFYGKIKWLKLYDFVPSDTVINELTTRVDYTPKHLARTNVNQYFEKNVDVAGATTSTTFNGVALTTSGTATNFLDETGNYSAPSTNGLTTVKVVLTATQVKALNTTPIQAIAAPGVGKIIKINSLFVKVKWGTVAYATNEAVALEYSGDNVIIQSSNVLFTTATKYVIGQANTSSWVAMKDNTAIDIFAPTIDPTAGDSAVTVYISYEIITL